MPVNTITVELLIDIAHIGRKGDIIDISSAQARNMLIPKGHARAITEDRLKQIADREKKTKDNARAKLEKAYEIQKLLDGQTIEYTLQGKNGKIFGGINEHDIISRVKQKWHIDFEKHDVKLPNKSHIKTAGSHMIYLHINRDTVAKIFAQVSVQD